MKARIKLNLAILLFVILLAGHNIQAARQTVTISMWDWYFTQSKFLDGEIERFMEKYPYINVERTRQVSHRYKDIINFAFRSNSLPDVFAIPVEERSEWFREGYFLPLNRWINKEFIDRFPKGSFVSGLNMYNGNYYSFPMQAPECWCQFYINNSVFKKAGLVNKNGEPIYPTTWEEVRTYAKIITENGNGEYYGLGIAYKPEHLHANMFYEWARIAGARGGNQELNLAVDYKEGTYNFARTDGIKKMFKFLKSLQADGSLYPNCLSLDDEALRVKFASGHIGMIMGGIWNMLGWETTHPEFTDYECMMIPPPDKKGYRGYLESRLTGVWYGISKNTKHPEEAWKLLEWFAHPEVGNRFVRSGFGLSIFPSANSMENARYRQMGQYMEISMKYTRRVPNPFARNPQLENVVVNPAYPNHIGLFWGVISGTIKEEDIPKKLKDLEDRLNKNLEEGFAEAIKKGYKVSPEDLKFPDWDPLKDY